MRNLVAKFVLRTWPVPYGHVRLMDMLKPPRVESDEVTTRLRRYGTLLKYNPNTYIGSFIYYRGIYEEKILRTIEAYLRPGMTFIDVGANIGLHSVVGAQLVGQSGRVMAFEPSSATRQRLMENIALNAFGNVRVLPVALGRSQDIAKLYTINQHNDGQSTLQPANPNHPSESVEITTLDTVMKGVDVKRGCVMKIDVEGAEMDVLRGGRDFLASARPHAIFIECIDSYLKRFGSSKAELFVWLHELGYATKALVRGRWVESAMPVDCEMLAVPKK